MQHSIDHCSLLKLPVIQDPRGNLTFVEGENHVPFSIGRVYFLYEVPAGTERGGHAHKELYQLIIATSGSFDIELNDGRGTKKEFHLDRPYSGLFIVPMMWRNIRNFSRGAVCMVLASAKYQESDYFRNYDEFSAAVFP